ncbi:glycosyltransferase [Gemmatimonas sp.]|uniref:glycosyltransferase n=1 Tax=Gemmatimonas sp. TaxID=1962908 RepID=UPI0035675F97
MADQFEVSVVVPCLNEEANISALVERTLATCQEAGISAEIVVVDDGSTDDTWSFIEGAIEIHGARIVGVRHTQNLGIPTAWRSGLDAASGRYACLIDGDLQNPPEEIPRLYGRLLESHYDIVQGTRSSIGRLKDSRLLYSRGLNVTLNVLFGMHSTDNKSGFVLGPRRVMVDIVSPRRRYRHFQTFIGVAAHRKGYSILEVETLFEERRAGTSFLDVKAPRVAMEAIADIPAALLEYRIEGSNRHGLSVVPRSLPLAKTSHPYSGWRRALFESYFATMPLHKWLITRRARSFYLELKQTEFLPAADLCVLQTVKLQRLIQHAYSHVPYYRRALDEAGIQPSDIESLDDLRSIPLLGKDDVRKNLYFDMFASDHKKKELHKISTSGSTGEPFTTYADRFQLEVRFATTLRALEWTGWQMGDRQARLWHQTIGLSRVQIVRERIDALFMRRLFVPAFEISAGTLELFVKRIRDHKPVLVDGYAESLNFLATYVNEGGDPGFSPKAMMSSAQALPENVRDRIEAGFKTKVFDKYGSREFSGIAYECDSGAAHHVMDESYILEILVDGRPALPGETGEIVITDLNNFSVPLIRYRIGDLATAVDQTIPCDCGRHLSRIGTIQGRTQAIVHCGNGAWLPGTFFAHFFKDYEHLVRFFQIHQTVKGAFTLKIVKGAQYTDAKFDTMVEELREFVGSEIETSIETEYVDEIPLVRTGKRSPVVSTVREDFQHLDSRADAS